MYSRVDSLIRKVTIFFGVSVTVMNHIVIEMLSPELECGCFELVIFHQQGVNSVHVQHPSVQLY